MYINNVTMSLGVGSDPEVRSAGDTKVLSFSGANKSPFKDKQGNQNTTWYNVSFFGRQAEALKDMMSKGTQLIAIGSIENRKWTDKEGKDRYSLDFRATSLQLTGPKRDAETSTDESSESIADDLF